MPNFDEKTGIRYGVISPHAINPEALNDIYNEGTDPAYEYGKTEILNAIRSLCDDLNLEYERIDTTSFIDEYSDHYESDGSGIMDYSDTDYDLHVSGDNFGIFVMRSPYYTFCRGCSPCAPGAGSLDSPIDKDPDYPESDKTLCLGHEWFDQSDDQYSRKIPYRVFRVSDDSEVI